MTELKVEKQVQIQKVMEYEVYGKTFENKAEAVDWKRKVEKDLSATWFIIESDVDTEGNFTSKSLFKMYDWLGMSGLIAKLNKMGIPLLTVMNKEYIKNVNIIKIGRFQDWEDMLKFEEENEFKETITVREEGLK